MAVISKTKVADRYSNVINTTLTLSAANTLTFQEIDVGLTIFQKVALLIERMDIFMPPASQAEFVAVTDWAQVALTQSNQIADLDIDEAAIIDMLQVTVVVHATAGNANIIINPWQRDFTQLGGGGLLIVPKPLFLAGLTAGFTAPAVITLRFYFRIIALKPDEYFELLESRRFFG